VAGERLEQAEAERKAFVNLASALDEDDYRSGYAERKAREQEAQEAYDELLARASEAVDLPEGGSAFKRLTASEQRQVARSLIASVVVSPPVAGAPVTDRFAVSFVNGG
jgi:hypothetical protein